MTKAATLILAAIAALFIQQANADEHIFGTSGTQGHKTFIATKTDETASKLFSRWSESAGWQVAWQVGSEIPITNPELLNKTAKLGNGDFESSVDSVINTIRNETDIPIFACLQFFAKSIIFVRFNPTLNCDEVFKHAAPIPQHDEQPETKEQQ